jgi:PadR family transcriptional regulator, regulatory protein PadR
MKPTDLIRVQQGSLYPALHRLEARGWIRAEWGTAESGRRAKFYTITRTGQKRLEQEHANWECLSGAMTLVLRRA